jgi:hypothetical protein
MMEGTPGDAVDAAITEALNRVAEASGNAADAFTRLATAAQEKADELEEEGEAEA